MNKLLNGTWDLTYFEQTDDNIKKPSELKKYNYKNISCTVPGNVELDLSRAESLPEDLFMGENILKAEQYETYEWWYHTVFTHKLGNERLFIHFEGVDCFAEYYINDILVGTSNNMLIPHEFDITDAIRDGENELYVRIKSAVSEENKIPQTLYAMACGWQSSTNSSSVRKAPHMYGWDIMPRAVSAGIWRDVYLKTYPECYFKQLYIVPYSANSVNDEHATLKINYELNLPGKYFKRDNKIRVCGICGESRFDAEMKIIFKSGHVVAEVENPKLWFPYGYGEANLYDVTVELISDGETVCSHKVKHGIRTVKLERTPSTDGKNGKFRIMVNGVEIMAKGSNWVPLDAYHSRDKERYPKALSLVKDIGCNILRCWGGNVYEDDEFFDFCDENGIMVWQDFSMACFAYPRTDEFCGLIKKEVEVIVKKLRHHACIMLWSGDNECDTGVMYNVNPNITNRVTREIIPNILLDHDYIRPYIASSPFVSNEIYETKRYADMCEDHLWGARDYYKSDYYKNSKAHFVSETGYHGCPSPESIKKFITKEKLWPYNDNSEWILHSSDQKKNPSRVLLMANQIKQMFGCIPDNLEEFALLSQFSQAEAKKYFIERVRIQRPYKTGVIWWNLLDGWPQMSDAVVDYYFNKKIAYYYIKNSQTPFCIFADEIKDGKQRIVASNDTLNKAEGEFSVYDAETNEVYLKGKISMEKNSNMQLGSIDAFYSQKRMLIIEWNVNSVVGRNHYIGYTVPYDKEQYKKWFEILKEKKIIETD